MEKILKVVFRKGKKKTNNVTEVVKMIEDDIIPHSEKKFQFGKKIRTRCIFDKGNSIYFKAFEEGVIIQRKKSKAKKPKVEPLIERGIYLDNHIAESFAEFIQVTSSARKMIENLTEDENGN